MGTNRKTPPQREALESFYSEDKYPSQREMEDYATALGLTFKQVRGWFIEKRRREKSKSGTFELSLHSAKRKTRAVSRGLISDEQDPSNHSADMTSENSSDWNYDCRISAFGKKNKKLFFLQELHSPDYIRKNVFCKDGPPLGVEFDSLPSAAPFHLNSGSRRSHSACSQDGRANKRRKVSNANDASVKKPGMGKGLLNNVSEERCFLEGGLRNSAPSRKHLGNGLVNRSARKKHGVGKGMINSYPVERHGMGKGLMTVWQAINPHGGDIPTGVNFAGEEVHRLSEISNSVSRKSCQDRKLQHQKPLAKQRKVRNSSQGKRKLLKKGREVTPTQDSGQKHLQKEKCELVPEGFISQERIDQIAMLADDDQVELKELQAGTCSDNFSSAGRRSCYPCKDFVPKFPPDSVKMKQPFHTHPWNSAPDMVKKLFRVFQFLYTHAVAMDMCPFTLDEFAQAFDDKDSMLLGKIHVALLKLLLSDVEMAITGEILPDLYKSCKFATLLHLVETQVSILEFWKRSLNSLTWIEILRQVLIAADFGSNQTAVRREGSSKETNSMAKYGLSPGTLKGELFRILSEQGSSGLRVSEIVKSLQMAEFNTSSTSEQLENVICSTLSSDITLFEKISPSAYRLRVTSLAKQGDDNHSDTEDSGSVDADPIGCENYSSSDDFGCKSATCGLKKFKHTNVCRSENCMVAVNTEIDESHQGELWLLGLMEGEYTDLSIEEKLSALVALTDLISAGTSIRIEDRTTVFTGSVPSIYQYGSGGKIKRSSAKQHDLSRLCWGHDGKLHGINRSCILACHPVDSSGLILKFNGKSSGDEDNRKETEVGAIPHSMQSVFLGYDRRFNRYWLFLGPCNEHDPGHKRVYFESCDDGHWEVIDNEEALRALLLVLDDRGKREAFLIESLEKREAFLCYEMSNKIAKDTTVIQLSQSEQSELVREESSPSSDVDNNLSLAEISKDCSSSSGSIIVKVGKGEELKQKWSRLQAFDTWIWNCFYSDLNAVRYSKRSYFDSLMRCGSCHDLYWRDERHCKKCHTTFELDFDLEEKYAIHAATCREQEENCMVGRHKVLPSQLQSLKAAVHAIESFMPDGALIGAWTKSSHRLWVKRLRRTSSLAELLQVISDFIGAINQDWLSKCKLVEDTNIVAHEVLASFATIPQTSSGVALWLTKFDALVAANLQGACSMIVKS